MTKKGVKHGINGCRSLIQDSSSKSQAGLSLVSKKYGGTEEFWAISARNRAAEAYFRHKRLLKTIGHRGVGVVQWQRAGLSSTGLQVRISPWTGKKYGGTEKSWTIVVGNRGGGWLDSCLIIDVPLGSFGQLDEVP